MTREHFEQQLVKLEGELLALGDLVISAIGSTEHAIETMDAGEAQQLIEADNDIDHKRFAIEADAFSVIATQQPIAKDLRDIVAILMIASELERIGDYCEGTAKLTLRMAAEPIQASLQDIQAMAKKDEELVRESLRAFRERDIDGAGRVWLEDDDIDDLYGQVFRKQLLEMATDRHYVRQGTYTIWIAHNFERIGDRVTNIAERVAFIVTGDVSTFRDQLRATSARV